MASLQRCGHILVAGLLVVGLGACGDADREEGGETGTTPIPESSTALASPSGTGSPSQSTPISWDTATFVEGRLSFTVGQGTVTFDEDGTSHSRDGTLSATMTANDPRVSGAVTGTWNSDRWGSLFDGALVQWGTAVLSNEGGSWEAPYAGVYTSESGDYISRWYVGKDGYEGLTFFMWISDPREFAWQGLIYEGEPPPQQ